MCHFPRTGLRPINLLGKLGHPDANRAFPSENEDSDNYTFQQYVLRLIFIAMSVLVSPKICHEVAVDVLSAVTALFGLPGRLDPKPCYSFLWGYVKHAVYVSFLPNDLE